MNTFPDLLICFPIQLAEQNIPSLLLGRDVDDIRTKDGVRRAVIDVLRELGMLPEVSKGAKPQLRLVESSEEPEK